MAKSTKGQRTEDKTWKRRIRETESMTYKQSRLLRELCEETDTKFNPLWSMEEARFKITELIELKRKRKGE